MVAPALRCRAQALNRARRAVRVSAINAISARVGRQHQMRQVLRPRQAPRQVRSAMKAKEMCAARSLAGISAA
jgi:hypothetical protein